MGNKILSSVIILILGIIFLYIGIKNLWPKFIFDQNEEMALGVFFITIGFSRLLWKILKIKNDKIPLYTGIITGILLLIAGFIFLYNNSSFWIAILTPGFIWFLANLIILLEKKFPNQKIFGLERLRIASSRHSASQKVKKNIDKKLLVK